MGSRIFGIDIETGNREQLLERARALIGKGGAIATVNPIMMSYAREDGDFRETLAGFELCIPDGVGIKLALFLRSEPCEVLAGVELGKLMLAEGEVTLALVGGKPGVARRAMENLKAEFPRVKEAFVFDGYNFDEGELAAVLGKTEPTLAYFCLGTPRQERLISRMREFSPSTVFIGLGGSLDVYSMDVRRAPRIFRALGAEWLWRIIRTPSRIKKLPRIFSFLAAAVRGE